EAGVNGMFFPAPVPSVTLRELPLRTAWTMSPVVAAPPSVRSPISLSAIALSSVVDRLLHPPRPAQPVLLVVVSRHQGVPAQQQRVGPALHVAREQDAERRQRPQEEVRLQLPRSRRERPRNGDR